jgi:hypothetical protein
VARADRSPLAVPSPRRHAPARGRSRVAPPAAPAGRRRARRPSALRRRGARAGALLAALAIAGGVTFALTRPSGSGPATDVADGWQQVSGTGWSMTVPSTWRAYPGYGNAAWHQPGSYSTYVEEDDVVGDDAGATLDAVDRSKRADSTLHYQRLGGSGDAAKATLSWREFVPADQRWLRLQEQAVTAHGRIYVVVAVAADEVFAPSQASFDRIIGSFRTG